MIQKLKKYWHSFISFFKFQSFFDFYFSFCLFVLLICSSTASCDGIQEGVFTDAFIKLNFLKTSSGYKILAPWEFPILVTSAFCALLGIFGKIFFDFISKYYGFLYYCKEIKKIEKTCPFYIYFLICLKNFPSKTYNKIKNIILEFIAAGDPNNHFYTGKFSGFPTYEAYANHKYVAYAEDIVKKKAIVLAPPRAIVPAGPVYDSPSTLYAFLKCPAYLHRDTSIYCQRSYHLSIEELLNAEQNELEENRKFLENFYFQNNIPTDTDDTPKDINLKKYIHFIELGEISLHYTYGYIFLHFFMYFLYFIFQISNYLSIDLFGYDFDYTAILTYSSPSCLIPFTIFGFDFSFNFWTFIVLIFLQNIAWVLLVIIYLIQNFLFKMFSPSMVDEDSFIYM